MNKQLMRIAPQRVVIIALLIISECLLSSQAQTATPAKSCVSGESQNHFLLQTEETLVAATSNTVALGSDVTSVTLSHDSEVLRCETMASQINSLRSGQRLYLTLRGVQATKQPGVLYQLYLCLPRGAKPARDDAHYVGTLD